MVSMVHPFLMMRGRVVLLSRPRVIMAAPDNDTEFKEEEEDETCAKERIIIIEIKRVFELELASKL